ncbi:hypothetical protein UlMin_030310 [Ulmus minor]
MVVAATLVMVPLGVLFNFSGLVAIFFIFVRPLLTSICRRINKVVAELWWLELVWLIDWWAGIKIELHTDSETRELLGKENTLVISNHRGDIDWLVFAIHLLSCFRRLEDFPIPFWLGLFVERTAFHSLGWKQLNSMQLLLRCLFKFVPAIYDCAVATPTNKPSPTILSIFARQTSVARLQNTSRHLMLELPETGDGIARWCRAAFNLQLQGICRPKKSKLVVMFWSCLTIYGSVKFFQRSKLLSSWKGLAASAAFLALVTILMQSQRHHHHKIPENLQHR